MSTIISLTFDLFDLLRPSVLDIAQQSEPYRNIGKMQVLYSFNFVEMDT